MRIREMFNKEYLAAEDLEGKDVTLTIARVAHESLRTPKGTEDKWVVYFQEMEARHQKDSKKVNKRLVLNLTNAKQIVKATGEADTDNWRGKQITLYPTTTKFGKDTVPCIRVR